MRTIILENGIKVKISDEDYSKYNKVNNGRVEIEKGERYYYIDIYGNEESSLNYGSYSDHYNFATKNYYKTEKEAERALEIFNILRKYSYTPIIEEFEDGDLEIYSNYVNVEDKLLRAADYSYYYGNSIFFKTEELAEQCAKKIGYTDWVKYITLGGVK